MEARTVEHIGVISAILNQKTRATLSQNDRSSRYYPSKEKIDVKWGSHHMGRILKLRKENPTPTQEEEVLNHPLEM